MATELTVKERAFAELIVQGTKSAAYRTVYSAKGSQATQATNAYKLSRKPKIKTEVARLLQQRAFPADDYKRLQETAIAGMTEMFLYDPDSRVRLKAGALLLAYAAEGLKLRPQPSAEDRAVAQERAIITAELRKIYARAGLTWHGEDAAPEHPEVIAREQELMVEPAEESEGGKAAVPSTPPPEPGQLAVNASAEEPAETSGGLSERETHLNTRDDEPTFRREAIPGRFPPAYRRVRIR
jgi:hypothetical protein